MTRIWRDADADLATLAGETLAVIGYGNQGRSQALNLRDSGLRVLVADRDDAVRARARADGFETVPVAEACARAGALLLLVPDETLPTLFREEVAPRLREGALLDFASGYGVAFGLVEPPASADVVLVGPRMIGPGVRDAFVAGTGFPAFVGIHQDASGRARARMLALARGIGATRGGCIELSFADEAALDLFTEQAFGPAFGRVLLSAIDTLVAAGFPPEAVLLELYLSGELAYSFAKIREVGMLRQMDFHSHTSQYGSITRSARFADLDPTLRERMGAILEEIRSGRFAEEWSKQQQGAAGLLARVRAAREQLPLAEWERRTREALGLDREGGAG
jgi:ketol-acid reductoisomerase